MLAAGWVSLHEETQVTLLNETEALDTKDRQGVGSGGWSLDPRTPANPVEAMAIWIKGLGEAMRGSQQ